MPKVIDITGQKFNMLTALYIDESVSKKRGTRWICKCDCGNIVSRYSQKLRNGTAFSCGCQKRPRTKKATTQKHKQPSIHYPNNQNKRRIYNAYQAMKKRCYNPNNKSYKYYGAKGITVCDEWLSSFKSFYEWSLLNGYKEELSIDRIDSNKGYSPSNCRWVTLHDQQQNRTDKILIAHGNEVLNLKQWCEKLNLPYSRVLNKKNDLIAEGIQVNYESLFNNLKCYEKPKRTGNKILQCDKEGNVIHIYSNINEAVKAGFSQPEISKSCNNVPKHKTHKGYIWRYAE